MDRDCACNTTIKNYRNTDHYRVKTCNYQSKHVDLIHIMNVKILYIQAL